MTRALKSQARRARYNDLTNIVVEWLMTGRRGRADDRHNGAAERHFQEIESTPVKDMGRAPRA